jgi:hypothetical protein
MQAPTGIQFVLPADCAGVWADRAEAAISMIATTINIFFVIRFLLR